ncbi:MAG: hypothetical protein FWG74_02090 [Planctomycetes bacterium]|nr:hypothetical protein [Planctomycetota bacterium]
MDKTEIAVISVLVICFLGFAAAVILAPPPKPETIACPQCRHEFEAPRNQRSAPILIPITRPR